MYGSEFEQKVDAIVVRYPHCAAALLPVLQEMCLWANRYFADTWTPPASFMERPM